MSTFRGIAFPFRMGSQSFPEQRTDADVVKDSMVQIILTGRNERIMRPDFGSGVYSLIFDNNDEVLETLMRQEVVGAIGRFEPRVIVREVAITREDSTMIVTIFYVVKLTGISDSLQVEIPTNTEAI